MYFQVDQDSVGWIRLRYSGFISMWITQRSVSSSRPARYCISPTPVMACVSSTSWTPCGCPSVWSGSSTWGAHARSPVTGSSRPRTCACCWWAPGSPSKQKNSTSSSWPSSRSLCQSPTAGKKTMASCFFQYIMSIYFLIYLKSVWPSVGQQVLCNNYAKMYIYLLLN